MTDLNRLFADLARHATELDPHAISATIVATMDTGLRAASYDSIGGPSAERSSHPERQALNERKDPTSADLSALEHHVGRYVEAIHWLATRSHTGPFPTDWRSAVPGHRRLADMDAVETLDRSGQRPARYVHQAGDALHDIELIGRRHMAREPDAFLIAWTSDLGDNQCCQIHLSIEPVGKYRQPRHGRSDLCKHCADLERRAGERPPEWLIALYEDKPGQVAWRNALSRWLQSCGVQAS